MCLNKRCYTFCIIALVPPVYVLCIHKPLYDLESLPGTTNLQICMTTKLVDLWSGPDMEDNEYIAGHKLNSGLEDQKYYSYAMSRLFTDLMGRITWPSSPDVIRALPS